jgi:MFS transporter, DHA1 family, multidrug resistance protein
MSAPDSTDERVPYTDRSTTPSTWQFTVVMGAVMAMASISTDFYLPAMPEIGASLAAPPGSVEFTISAYMFGSSIGQLFWGPISDRIGRRRPIIAGILMFLVGSTGCALSGDILTMIAWRIVQAVGASAAVVLSNATVRDLHDGIRGAQVRSTLMTVMLISPLAAPLVGAQILALAGWQAIFWTLVVIGVAILAAYSRLSETLPLQRRNTIRLGQVLRQYAMLARDRNVRGYALVSGCYTFGVFGYIAGTPHAYITYFGVPPALYGLLFGTGIFGVMLLNFINARVVGRFGMTRMIQAGTTLSAISALALLVDTTTGFGGLWGVAVPLFFYAASGGFFMGNAMTGALAGHPDRAGAVSAVVGAFNFACSTAGSALVGQFAGDGVLSIGIVVAIGGLGTLLAGRAIPPR